MSKEIWRDIKGYKGFYQASSLGRVRSLKRTVKGSYGQPHKLKGKILALISHDNGYIRVNLSKKGIAKSLMVHRLVAIALALNLENKPQVNHINGIKNDNRIKNLEWCTSKENINHAARIGLSHPYSKLKKRDVLNIKRLLKKKFLTQIDIAKIYKVDRTTIGKIKLNKTWKHLKEK